VKKVTVLALLAVSALLAVILLTFFGLSVTQNFDSSGGAASPGGPNGSPPGSIDPNPEAEQLALAVSQAGDELETGRILFNPPKRMSVGETERVEVRISQSIDKDLTRGLKGEGVPRTVRIKVGALMRVALTGNGFDIRPLNQHREQLVESSGFTEWAWDITALRGGHQTLVLAVSVRVPIPGPRDVHKDLRVLERRIRVGVNPVFSVTTWWQRNWKWTIGALLALLAGVPGLLGLNRRKNSGQVESASQKTREEPAVVDVRSRAERDEEQRVDS
jgi:hypothetical protein